MIEGLDKMKKLTLQIDKASFKAILNGRQTIEHRFIYPNNASKYVTQTDMPDETLMIECVKYDALYLINGRRKDAPRLLVEVLEAIFVPFTDEDGNDQIYVENGEEYLVCQVWYHLGRILGTEGADALVESPEEKERLIAEYKKNGGTIVWEDEVALLK